MGPKINCHSILYTTLFTWIITICSGFVLISAADGQNSNVKFFTPGESQVYQWKSTVLLNEIEENSNNVGFRLAGQVFVSSIWGTEDDSKKILKLELNSPQLYVKSRKVPSSDDLIPHSSNLDQLPNKPFLIVWNQGSIEKILFATEEPTSIKNLKKGIASLFQVQSTDGDSSESDSSGHCTVSYSSLSSNIILKTKTRCSSEDLGNFSHLDHILGAKIQSIRNTEYLVDDSIRFFKNIVSKESHEMTVGFKKELRNTVQSEQILSHVETKTCDVVKSSTLKGAIGTISGKEGIAFSEESLITERDDLVNDENKKLSKELDLLRENIKTENLGNLKSAKAFLHLLKTTRRSGSEDIVKVLQSKKNKLILPQIYDILGYSQTKNSHSAVMKQLHLDVEDEEQSDLVERYLWALSFSLHPNADILEDLLNKYRKYTKIPQKIRDTLVLTLASMARTLSKSKNNEYDVSTILKKVEETIINGLDYAKDDDRYIFFSALKNLLSPATIPNLVSFIKNGTLKEEVLAWRALKTFDKELWTEDLLKMAEKTLFQLDKKHDPSSRTIASDILLASPISDCKLSDLLNFVAGNDSNFEIRQYVFQSIRMLSDKDEQFNDRVQRIVRSSKRLNNYSGLSPRGLSTALTRDIFRSSSANGSLVSVQEIKSGIVKRGVVDVVLDKNGISKELFTLGIFSCGLDSFMSSDNEEENEIEEPATAGMELTIMGTQIRPFVFFEGQGELMGHVWSGTASEKTPAFQALILLQDHQEYLRLGTGFVAEINLKGAVSFDLSGQIQISLWNRNSESLVEKSAGFITNGLIQVDTSFVHSLVEFSASIEPKLSLQIDADFSSNVKLCMRLSQPEALFRHNIVKSERIPGSKHKIRIAKYKKLVVPGTTYALNKKNNEMCSAIFS